MYAEFAWLVAYSGVPPEGEVSYVPGARAADACSILLQVSLVLHSTALFTFSIRLGSTELYSANADLKVADARGVPLLEPSLFI